VLKFPVGIVSFVLCVTGLSIVVAFIGAPFMQEFGWFTIAGERVDSWPLALALVRQGRKAEALQLLAQANGRAGATPRIAYLYGVALADAGRTREAIKVLEASDRREGDRDVLLGLASIRRDAGDAAGARAALARLAAINPDDPALRGRAP